MAGRSYPPDTDIVVPTAIIFPGPQVERYFYKVADLELVQLGDFVISK